MQDIKTRCGYAVILGAPNAGKSTLINQIIGTKISIVSSKVQTTRTRIIGIAMPDDETQIIFVDTPGIFQPRASKKLERAMVASAWEALGDGDCLLLLVDVNKGVCQQTQMILDKIKEGAFPKPVYLVLNKIDGFPREKLLGLTQEINGLYDFSATFMISALKGKGVKDLLKKVADDMPCSPFLFDPEQVSDMPMRLIAAEVTREKLFHKLHKELPYELTVETESWDQNDDGSVTIHQTIYVTRDGHKKIILGKGGDMIKHVGIKSRTDLEEMLEARVHLKLFVKVRENWMSDAERFSLWGLDPQA